MVTLRKVSNAEKETKQNINVVQSPPSYDDVIKQNARYASVNLENNTLEMDRAVNVKARKPQKFKRKRVETFCRSCGMQMLTKIEYRTSFVTHATAATIVCIGGWPIAWLPYVFNFCKVPNHYCPHCYAYVSKQ